MLTSQELTNLLRERGYKVTPQRLAVYEALADETWHPNAEMLFNKLQPKFPAMSFATVYKTVEILHDINVIQILNTGEDSFRYDADISEHYHLRCLKCGIGYSGCTGCREAERLYYQPPSVLFLWSVSEVLHDALNYKEVYRFSS